MKKKKTYQKLLLLFSILVFALVLILRLVFYVRFIPSESMEHTIPTYTFILFNKDTSIKRADIILFSEDGRDLVKRVIGIEGDIINIQDGYVYLNGRKLEETYAIGKTGPNGTYIIPSGEFFVLGDNRENSKDSRFWTYPYLKQADVKGKSVLWLG